MEQIVDTGQQASNTSNSNSSSKTPLLIAGVFLLVVVVGLVAFFALKGGSVSKNEIEILSEQVGQIDEDPVIVGTIQKNLATASKASSPEDQYKSLYYASSSGATRYSRSHNPKLREFLVNLDQFAASKYPSLYKKSEFSVNCSDEQCSALNYPGEISNIKLSIEEVDLGINQQTILDILYDAAIAKEDEVDRKFNDYAFALQIVNQEAANGNEAASEISAKLDNYLESNYADLYSQYKKANIKQ